MPHISLNNTPDECVMSTKTDLGGEYIACGWSQTSFCLRLCTGHKELERICIIQPQVYLLLLFYFSNLSMINKCIPTGSNLCCVALWIKNSGTYITCRKARIHFIVENLSFYCHFLHIHNLMCRHLIIWKLIQVWFMCEYLDTLGCCNVTWVMFDDWR